MKRLFFVGSKLNELDSLVDELNSRGIKRPQIHVLTNNDAELADHPKLQDVEAVLRTDVVHGTARGSVLGAVLATAVLGLAYAAGWTSVTWVPFIFLSIVCLGFCTWQGGLLGIQIRNHRFRPFNKALKQGKHILMLDVPKTRLDEMRLAVSTMTSFKEQGEGEGAPDWVIEAQNKYDKFVEVMP